MYQNYKSVLSQFSLTKTSPLNQSNSFPLDFHFAITRLSDDNMFLNLHFCMLQALHLHSTIN
jgi:hypothetical protein